MSDALPPTGRRFSSLALAAIALAAGVLLAMNRQGVAQFDRLEIVRDGRAVIELNSDENGGVLRLFNGRGVEALALRIAEDGGAHIRVNDSAGARVLSVLSGEDSVLITTRDGGRDVIVLDSDAPFDVDEGTGDSIKVLAARIADVDTRLKTLRDENEQLARYLRDRTPGVTNNSAIDRLQRDLTTLERAQRDIDRDLRQLGDTDTRRRMDVDELRRRVSRLESRIR